MRTPCLPRLLPTLRLALLALLAATAADAAEPPSIMIVFDASGSMWGTIDGSKTQKFVLARDAVGKAVGELPPEAKVGLVSFGQKRRGDCTDVEVVVKPEPHSRERLIGPLDKLNPRGKGPITLGMREAAKVLAGAPSASIIVLHDDLDNCQQDACTAAEDIHAANPKIAIHTISIGMPSEDAQRIACVAKATGGRRFEAKNAGDLASMIGEAVKLAGLDAGRRPAQTQPAAQPRATPPPAPAAARRPSAPAAKPIAGGKPGLRLSASLAANGEPITEPIAWRVSREGAGAEPAILETTAAQASVDTAPGTYIVEARIGLVSARQKVDVGDKPTEANLVLNAGAAWLIARTHRGGPVLEGAVFTLSEMAGGDSKAKEPPKPLWMSRDTEPLVYVPAGTYRVSVQRGLVSQERSVVVEPGISGELDIVLGAGLLQLKALAREGGDLADAVVFIVAEDDPDSPQGRREVARSAAPAPEFTLPAGTYYVTVRQGANEIRERIAIGVGDTITREIVLGFARVSLATKVDGSAAQSKETLTYRVLRLDGEQREVGRYGASTQQVDLPAGRYRIEAQVGGQNVRAVRDIEVAAGRSAQVAFDLQTARLTLRSTEAGHANADIVWEIKDAGGRTVARTTTAETRLVLSPGKYTVRGEIKGRRPLERTVELKSGERRTVDAD